MAEIEYLVGQRFYNMVFVGEVQSSKDRRGMFICTCGKIFTAYIHSIKSNATKTCGCGRNESVRIRKTTHGLSRHPLYNVWNNMNERCYNTNNKSYKTYGGNGVEICDEWKNSFILFYDWCISNGWTNKLQLDKDFKGNGKLYSPNTCCFVTPKQNSNKRITSRYLEYNGLLMTMAEWAYKIGINQSTLHARLRMGWSLEKAILTTLKNKK